MKQCQLGGCQTTISDNAPDFCDTHNQFNGGFLRKSISASIQYQMEKGHVTKKMLAMVCGVQPSVVTKWLSGKHNFTIDTISMISGKLGAMII